MANPTIGEVNCAHCQGTAAVRQYATGARLLYYVCGRCGIIRPATRAGQDWILERARMFSDAERTAADNAPAAEQENYPSHDKGPAEIVAPAPSGGDDAAHNPEKRGFLADVEI